MISDFKGVRGELFNINQIEEIVSEMMLFGLVSPFMSVFFKLSNSTEVLFVGGRLDVAW